MEDIDLGVCLDAVKNRGGYGVLPRFDLIKEGRRGVLKLDMSVKCDDGGLRRGGAGVAHDGSFSSFIGSEIREGVRVRASKRERRRSRDL